MDISVIILNYRSQQYLPDCLKSLAKFLQNISYEIIIINNDSCSITSILASKNIQIKDTGCNLGFAKACNLGAKIANGKILLFLNPDTKILYGKVKLVLNEINNPDIGIISPLILSPNGEIQKWSSGFAISLWSIIRNNISLSKDKSLWNNSSTINPDWVSGVAMFIKKTTFDAIGGFDENFFMYFEDVDLCKRVKALGLNIKILSNIKVLHLEGKSSTSKSLQKKIYYSSQDYYFKKHHTFALLFIMKLFRGLAIKIRNKLSR